MERKIDLIGSWSDANWAVNLPAEHIPAALSHLAALQGALSARLIADLCDLTGGASGRAIDRASLPEWSLTIDDMIRMTGKSRRWIFRHKKLPFIRVISRKTLVGDETLLSRWIANQRA